jgi:hypothetical protein
MSHKPQHPMNKIDEIKKEAHAWFIGVPQRPDGIYEYGYDDVTRLIVGFAAKLASLPVHPQSMTEGKEDMSGSDWTAAGNMCYDGTGRPFRLEYAIRFGTARDEICFHDMEIKRTIGVTDQQAHYYRQCNKCGCIVWGNIPPSILKEDFCRH